MRRRTFMLMFVILVIALAQVGCLAPDLAPFNPNPNAGDLVGYCDRDDEGLWVYVRNIGTADAPATTTRVEFKWGGGTEAQKIDVATPAIAKDDTQKVGPFAVPGGCFDPDCEFTITVDANKEVAEVNEDNNTADGQCLG